MESGMRRVSLTMDMDGRHREEREREGRGKPAAAPGPERNRETERKREEDREGSPGTRRQSESHKVDCPLTVFVPVFTTRIREKGV